MANGDDRREREEESFHSIQRGAVMKAFLEERISSETRNHARNGINTSPNQLPFLSSFNILSPYTVQNNSKSYNWILPPQVTITC